MNTGLVPLRNFAIVSDGVYRSAQPLYRYEYSWMKEVLGIDTIINLRAESTHDESFVPPGIRVINIPVPDHGKPTRKQAEFFMQLIRDAQTNGKRVLFHCEHGHGRTSTFCVLARLEMGWDLEHAIEEEKKRYHYKFKHKIQLQFLRRYFSSAHAQ